MPAAVDANANTVHDADDDSYSNSNNDDVVYADTGNDADADAPRSTRTDDDPAAGNRLVIRTRGVRLQKVKAVTALNS